MVRGIAHSRRAASEAGRLIEVENPKQLFLMLSANRIDVAVHGAFGARAEVEILTGEEIFLDEAPIGTVNSHHFLRDTFRHEAVVVAGTLREMVDSGEFASIFQAERARLIAKAMAREPGE